MKKKYIIAVLFFSSLWGFSEAVLGGVLYSAGIPYASVPLTVIAFVILSFAVVYFPQKGTATLIAALAMIYKFLNVPFFACHLLGILLVGICYDLFFSVLKIKNRSIGAAAAVYLSYISFAFLITYVFRYEHWVQAGFVKLLTHVGIGGTMAALCCAIFVPVSFRLAQGLKTGYAMPFELKLKPAAGAVSLLTTGLWIFGIAVYLFGGH